MDKKPDATSSDHDAMAPYWRMIETMMGGTSAMRDEREYLPKFPQERDKDYEFRRSHAKFTNIYRDIVENLAQRPFCREVMLEDGSAPPEVDSLKDDIDGQGNNLHVFAGNVFFAGISSALDWVLVDYTANVPEGATRADEQALGARPYWVRIPASSMLAVYSDIIDGREQFVHARYLEPYVERDGWGEKKARRVRILNREPLDSGGYAPATYEVWEETKTDKGALEWLRVVAPTPISIGVVPLVPFVTGRRLGATWQFHPPMRDAAELQIEHYQQESALKHIKALTAFPMLAGNGVTPPIGDDGKPAPVPVGPQSVLYAPPSGDGGSHGEWRFIEPSAESLKFLAEDIKETARELRELGRQPLTAQSGNLTVVTTAFAAQKGNAAIQAWALNLKDALEAAFHYTGMWLGQDASGANVVIDTDFDLGFGDDESFGHVLSLRQSGDISREAEIHEAKRRGILDADYDSDEDMNAILREMDDPEEPEDTDPDREIDDLGRRISGS